MELTYKINKGKNGNETVSVEHDGTDLLVNASKEKLIELTQTVREKVLEDMEKNTSVCDIPTEADYSGVEIVELLPELSLDDYRAAMNLANNEADQRLGENRYMLLSWYDRDRDFESPQGASECHANSAIPGYVDYALYRNATLKVDIENGRFVFFYLPVDIGS